MSDASLQELGDQFVIYLKSKMPGASDLSISGLTRIHGGASRETYRLRLAYTEGETKKNRGLILRRDPVGSLIDTERALEFTAYKGFHGTDVPVPEAIYLEEDLKWMGRPFFVMELIDGCDVAQPFSESPYGAWGDDMARRFFGTLGSIAARDVSETGLEKHVEVPALDACWKKELDHWERVINEDELEPQPIVRAAIRHLRRNPPPPAQRLCVIHGDYRSGNFLYDSDGKIQGILDWEMVHIGDPFEDLAWAMNPLWSHGTPEKPAGMVEAAKAIAFWEETSSCKFDAEAFNWWNIFSCVKGIGIWISSSKEYSDGENNDPVLALAAWICTSAHDKILVEFLRNKELGACSS